MFVYNKQLILVFFRLILIGNYVELVPVIDRDEYVIAKLFWGNRIVLFYIINYVRIFVIKKLH